MWNGDLSSSWPHNCILRLKVGGKCGFPSWLILDPWVPVTGFPHPPWGPRVWALGLSSVSLRCSRLQVPLGFGEALPLGGELAGLLQPPRCLQNGRRSPLWAGTVLLQGVVGACSSPGISAPTPFLTWQSFFVVNFIFGCHGSLLLYKGFL